MYLCALMQNHLRKNYNASENLCMCLSPGSMWCLRTERDQRKDNSGRATESCAAYSTHCNICQEIFFGPHHSSPLWVNTSVPILMNRKWWPYGALDQPSHSRAWGLEGTEDVQEHVQKTMYPGSGKCRVSLIMCLPILSTFFLFVTLPVCLKVPLPSSSIPSHMVHHKEELLIQIQKDF